MGKYKILRILKKGGKSKSVKLLGRPDGERVVRKKYNLNIRVHWEHFLNEVQILRHLEELKCDFVPRIRDIDKHRGVLLLSYCGKSLEQKQNKYQEEIRELLVNLSKEYGIRRIEYGEEVLRIHPKNVCKLDGKLYLIDFGSLHWKIFV